MRLVDVTNALRSGASPSSASRDPRDPRDSRDRDGLGGALLTFGAPSEWWHDSIILGRLSALALRYFASKATQKPWRLDWLDLGRVSSPMSLKEKDLCLFFNGASLNFRFLQTKKGLFIVRAWLQHVQRAREKHRLGLRSQLQLALRRWHRWGVSAHDFTLTVGETTGLRVCAKR